MAYSDVGAVLAIVLEAIQAAGLTSGDRKALLRFAVQQAFESACSTQPQKNEAPAIGTLGIVDTARTLAARHSGRSVHAVSTSGVIDGLRSDGRQDLAKRLQRASRSRRLMAHPDTLLAQDLGDHYSTSGQLSSASVTEGGHYECATEASDSDLPFCSGYPTLGAWDAWCDARASSSSSTDHEHSLHIDDVGWQVFSCLGGGKSCFDKVCAVTVPTKPTKRLPKVVGLRPFTIPLDIDGGFALCKSCDRDVEPGERAWRTEECTSSWEVVCLDCGS